METSALKTESAHFSETLAAANQSRRRLNPKDHHHNRHNRENFKSHFAHHVFIGHLYFSEIQKLQVFGNTAIKKRFEPSP
jgi:hypothetical protein